MTNEEKTNLLLQRIKEGDKKAKGKDVWRPLNLKTTNSYALPMLAVSS